MSKQMETTRKGDTMRSPHAIKQGGAAVLAVLALAACNTEVTNPGPVQGDQLENETAQPAMVAGLERAFGDALKWIAYTSG